MHRRLLVTSVVLACVLAIAAGCGSSHKSAQLPSPVRVGTAVTVETPVSIAALAKDPASFAGQTVRLEGTVKAVCQGMGCWVEVQQPDGTSFLAKSLDESVRLPKDCAGRKIVVQGVVAALPTKAAEEPLPEGHVCPRPSYVVATQGAELR